MPFLEALRAGKTVAPANKEALVIAGDLIMNEARKYKARIIPIDSDLARARLIIGPLRSAPSTRSPQE